MSDLTVDLAAVKRIAADLSRAADSADAVKQGHEGLSDTRAATGRGDAAHAVETFLSRWKYGCGLLEGDLRTLAAWLQQSAAAYRQTDDALAKAAENGH